MAKLLLLSQSDCDINKLLLEPKSTPNKQGFAGLDCWIVQSGSQSNLVDWIDNPKKSIEK